MKLAILTSRATSLREVARAIAYVARKNGLTPILLEYAPSPVDLKRMAHMALVVMTMNPLLSRSWFLAVRDYNRERLPAWIYTTTEGRLPRRYVKKWMQRDLQFIANSMYTRTKLEEAGLQVIDVVPHGVVWSDIELALKTRDAARRYLAETLGEGVYFVTVASSLKRKGHDFYAPAIALATQECQECKFYILTTEQARHYYEGVPNVHVDVRFGQLSRQEVLSLIAAADWYVQPSLAEGFGLPVLEAQALATPVIHVDYPPLSEHSHPDNLRVPFERIVYDTMGEGIDYELHVYEPEKMAEAILKARDMVVNRRDDYERRSERVQQHARRYDAENMYARLLDIMVEVMEIV